MIEPKPTRLPATDPQTLRAFVAVAREGNVSRAARILEIPRSAMLHAMRRYGLGARTLGVTE